MQWPDDTAWSPGNGSGWEIEADSRRCLPSWAGRQRSSDQIAGTIDSGRKGAYRLDSIIPFCHQWWPHYDWCQYNLLYDGTGNDEKMQWCHRHHKFNQNHQYLYSWRIWKQPDLHWWTLLEQNRGICRFWHRADVLKLYGGQGIYQLQCSHPEIRHAG